MRKSKELQAKEAAREAKLRRLAYLFLLGLALKLLLDGLVASQAKTPEEDAGFPEVMVFFAVEPKVPGTVVCLVDSTKRQRVVSTEKILRLTTPGPVSWTVQAPGFQAKSGQFEVPEEDPADFRIPVALESLVRRGANRPGRRVAPAGRIRQSP